MALKGTRNTNGTIFLETVNPVDDSPIVDRLGNPFDSVQHQNAEEVHAKVVSLNEATRHWGSTSITQRRKFLKSLHRNLYERRQELAELVSQEVGKPLVESYTEVLVSLDYLTHYRGALQKLESTFQRGTNLVNRHKSAYLHTQSHGVMAAIEPWNFPLMLPMMAVSRLLSAGNTVILKPSPETPHVANHIEALVEESLHDALGESYSVLLTAQGNTATGIAVVNEVVKGNVENLFFTGSNATGLAIARQLSPHAKTPYLELGGKDAFLVCDDANIHAAARACVMGALYNNGQACTAVERVYVTKKNADAFLELLVDEVKNLRVGTGDYRGPTVVGMNPHSAVGPMINTQGIEKVLAHLNDAYAKGAEHVYGGSVIYHQFITPAVITNVNHSMDVMTQETFGPIIPVMVVESEEDLIRYANDSRYGLGASVWSQNIEKGHAYARQLHVGTAYVNDAMWGITDPRLDWKGLRQSGMGPDNHMQDFAQSAERKTLIDGSHRPFWMHESLDNGWMAQPSHAKEDFFRYGIEVLHGSIRERVRALPAMLHAAFSLKQ